MDSLSVVSLNVRGLHNSSKRHTVYRWLKENKYNLCCLQETYCTKSHDVRFKRGWSGDIFHSFSNSTHSRGVSVMICKGLKYNVTSHHSDDMGRLLLLNLEIDKQEFTVVNVYAPNEVHDRIVFFRYMQSFINSYASNKNRLIIDGDYDCVLSESDRVTRKIDRSTDILKDTMVKLNVVDIWRILNPNTKEITYIDPSCNMRNSQIDLVLCSSSLQSKCSRSVIAQAPAPDHRAVCLAIETNKNRRGKGYWKLNNSHLEHEEYQEGIVKLYEEVIEEYDEYVTKSVLWDYFKLRVKQFRISYGIKLAKNFNDLCKTRESDLDHLDRQIAQSNNPELVQERRQLKEELDELYSRKAGGYQIRSRARWIKQGEKSSKYFLDLEKQRQNANSIGCLKNKNGTYVHTEKEILDTAKEYYSDLYRDKSSKVQEIKMFFDSIVPEKQFSDEMREKCEGEFGTSECKVAIDKMKKNKSPGLNGISIEYYKKFWPLIGNLLVKVLNSSYENGILTESQKVAVFALIFKKGDDCDLSNYRPISLTNVDYKIVAFVLAARLQCVLDSLISHDQTAYIKNRYMGYNIRLIEDVIDHFDKLQMNGVMFFADFQKAFDSLDWNFMFSTLDFF